MAIQTTSPQPGLGAASADMAQRLQAARPAAKKETERAPVVVKDPSAIDILIYKGREELEMILMNHKQRHHLVSQYVKNPAKDTVHKETGMSPFLEAFYKGL
jgi:hypothetical protein